MATKEMIARYLRELKLKTVPLGYDKVAVMNAFAELDSMYSSMCIPSSDGSDNEAESLRLKVSEQSDQIEALMKTEELLEKENNDLKIENSKLQREVIDAKKQQMTYIDKSNELTSAILEAQEMRKRREQQLEAEKQLVASRAKREAENLIMKAKMEAKRQKEAIEKEVNDLTEKKEMVITQLKCISETITVQLSSAGYGDDYSDDIYDIKNMFSDSFLTDDDKDLNDDDLNNNNANK